jgi:GH25 family lysozyme M1 (1,4-beta-N-acetylmuramidase)
MLPSQFALGLDISKYDIRYDASVRRADFVIQRASYGLKRDESFELLWADIQPVPIRGAYHYYNTGVPWRAQVDHFLSVVAGRGFHFLALDYETYYNNLNADSAEDARRILEHLQAETELPVLLYANPNVYETCLLPYGNWMKGWPLWISQWNSKWWHENRATGPRLPKGRSEWTIWQYGGDYQHPSGSWSVPGYGEGAAWGVQSKHVDLDVFNGSAEEMRAWCGLDEGAQQPPSNSPAILNADAIRLDELTRLERYVRDRVAELSS